VYFGLNDEPGDIDETAGVMAAGAAGRTVRR